MAELIDLRERLNRVISELDADKDGSTRQVRDYDQPTPDPEEIAARWGLDTTPPDNDPPAWFQERFGDRYPEDTQ